MRGWIWGRGVKVNEEGFVRDGGNGVWLWEIRGKEYNGGEIVEEIMEKVRE